MTMTDQDHDYGFGTRAIHAGAIPDPVTGARATPIHQTTSFVFDSAEHAASLFNLQTFGNVYSRISNPTVAVLEERVASLEGGRAALACATGMAAQMTALLAILKAGDHIVAASTLYGGTVGQLGIGFSRLGIETTFVDPEDPDNFRRAIRPNTRAVYGETLGNPLVNVFDIEAVARHRARARPAAGHRQHGGQPLPVQPLRLRRRHRGAQRHQVPGRPRHDDGRRGGGVGQVRLGQRRWRARSSPRCWSPAAPTTASSSTRPSATSATR